MTPPFSYISLIVPLEEGLTLYLNKLELSSPKDNLYQVRLILTAGSGEDFSVYFYSFAIIYPWRGAIPFFKDTSIFILQ
jgi:hypothetical protein